MDNILTVTRLNFYIKNIIEGDPKLTNIVVKGEISNLTKHYTGHYYFNLKDESSKISCMMFSSYVKQLKSDINNGDQVLIIGYVSCYEKSGTYQLYIKRIEPLGLGQYLLKIEELKKKLKAEGLFDKEKRKINRFPKSIGIITSKSGAAIKDFIHTIHSRFPCDIYVFCCKVQGDDAHKSIVKAIQKADNFGCDTLILGRGGGSEDDLKCFNEEDVVRAVYSCNTPIISAVGHQIDTTLVDYVSDLVAITPTDAGEKAVYDINDIIDTINSSKNMLKSIISEKIEEKRKELMLILSNKALISPIEYFNQSIDKVTRLQEKASLIMSYKLNKEEANIKNYVLLLEGYISKTLNKKELLLKGNIMKLEALNPSSYIDKGYSMIYSDTKVVTSIKTISINQIIKIDLKDGYVNAKVISKENK